MNKGTPADPLREALAKAFNFGQDYWADAAELTLAKYRTFVDETCAALATKPAEPVHWPSAKVTVHEDEVSYGVHRLTIELYAPGLPPGVYTMYLPGHPTESAAKPVGAVQPTDEQFDEIACRYGTMGSEGAWIFREGALREFVDEVTSASQEEKK